MVTDRQPRRSAGLLVHRRDGDGRLQVLLGHMGGPFWVRKQERAWSVPKGEHGPDEEPLAAAHREFLEETGLPVPDGEPVPLGMVRQSGGKEVTVWAVEGDLDAADAASNTFSMEWPRGSGRLQEFPELDRFAWVEVDAARELLVAGQVAFLDRLLAHLGTDRA
jgi:predicted NUDIX family NTP pyrophosphohydrolase